MSAKIKKKDALDYHEYPTPGKIEVNPTKKHSTQRELSLAYSPGVAEPCLEIADNPLNASRYTARGNLVAVVTNGSAALGLGNIGALASKPIMEGKAVLFKKFAQIDCFDIEIDESDPHTLDRAIADYRKAIDKYSTPQQASYAAFQAAKVYQLEAKWKEIINIIDEYEEKLGGEADLSKAMFWKGQAYIQLEKIDKAVADYIDTIEHHLGWKVDRFSDANPPACSDAARSE